MPEDLDADQHVFLQQLDRAHAGEADDEWMASMLAGIRESDLFDKSAEPLDWLIRWSEDTTYEPRQLYQ